MLSPHEVSPSGASAESPGWALLLPKPAPSGSSQNTLALGALAQTHGFRPWSQAQEAAGPLSHACAHTRSKTRGSKKQDDGLTAQQGAELGPNLRLRVPDTAALPMTGPASSPWYCGSVYPVAAWQNPHRGGPEPWVQTPIRQLNNSDKTQKSLGSTPSPGEQRHSQDL